MVTTIGRIRRLSPVKLNRGVEADTGQRLSYYATHPEEIGDRLRELDAEWDIERAIELEAAGTVLTGVALGLTVDRKWFLLPALAATMLLLHNLNGQYPLLPLLRRLGLRTATEIAQERYALKAMRGDFEQVPPEAAPEQALAAVAAAA